MPFLDDIHAILSLKDQFLPSHGKNWVCITNLQIIYWDTSTFKAPSPVQVHQLVSHICITIVLTLLISH